MDPEFYSAECVEYFTLSNYSLENGVKKLIALFGYA